MDANVVWKNDLSFMSEDKKNISIPMSAEPSAGGTGEGYEPMQLVAIGLAGCTALDVMSILQKKRQDITHFEVQVHADRAADFPKVFTNIVIAYIIEGHNVEPAAVERSIELSAKKYCPVQAMLGKACNITHQYSIKDA